MQNQTTKHFKPHKLEEAGSVLIGRGSRRIYELAEEALQDAQTFDEARDKLPLVMRNAVRDYVLELSEGDIPQGFNIDTFTEWVRSQSDEMWRALSVDAFLVGYSLAHKSIGVATVWSYQGFDLQEIYKPGFVYFIAKEPLKKFGRKPETKEEMVECMRLVYQAEKKKAKGETIVGGGNVDCTIVRQNGEMTFEDLGPLEKLKPVNKKPSKNALCPCGSGRKYKACCGKVK